MKRKIGKILQSLLTKYNLGPRLAKKVLSTESALKRINERGIEIKTVIDIGASNGQWSKATMNIFPKANYMLVEAQQDHENDLKSFKASHKNVDYRIVAAGNYDGTIKFDNTSLFGGIAMEGEAQVGQNYTEVPIIKMDSLLKNSNLNGPYLLKLDTHGFERQIFEGSEEVLKNANLIVVETYNFEILPGCMRFHEICSYLEQRGFRCIDISEPLFRVKDQSLWQFDLFFIKSDRKEFLSNEYE